MCVRVCVIADEAQTDDVDDGGCVFFFSSHSLFFFILSAANDDDDDDGMKGFFGGKTEETATAPSQRPRSEPGLGGERVHGHVLTDEDIRRDQERRVCTLAEALQEKVEESDRLYHQMKTYREQCKTLEEAAVADKKRIEELEARVKKLEDDHASDVVCFLAWRAEGVLLFMLAAGWWGNRSLWRRSTTERQSCRRRWLR